MITFQKPYRLNEAKSYLHDVLASMHVEGDGKYTKLCKEQLNKLLSVDKSFMMSSCTHALECALQVIGLEEGDEVIVPSFTYPSTANAVVLAGAKVIFAEVEPTNMTIDVSVLKDKINLKTKAIIVVHYGGVMCDMESIMKLAKEHNLIVVEDAAQSFLSYSTQEAFKNHYSGTIGDFGCFSFHGTKDFVAGEGGALVVNNPKYVEAVEIFRQKGTNRSAFINGKSAFYEWVDKGSSHSPSELVMALLASQLELSKEILDKRIQVYKRYLDAITTSINRHDCSNVVRCSTDSPLGHNGHLFFMIFTKEILAKDFIEFMYHEGIETRTHFVPLHESVMGKQFIEDKDRFNTEKAIGKRLVRLPIYPDLIDNEIDYILKKVDEYLQKI